MNINAASVQVSAMSQTVLKQMLSDKLAASIEFARDAMSLRQSHEVFSLPKEYAWLYQQAPC